MPAVNPAIAAPPPDETLARPRRPAAPPFRVAPTGVALLALLAAACSPSPGELHLRRGDFRTRHLLSGELEAARADEIRVPALPEWRVTVRWLIEDGRNVTAGEPVAELDKTPFVQPLLESELAAASAERELARGDATARAERIRRLVALEEQLAALEKARIDADVPPELESLYDRTRKELAVVRAQVAADRAHDDREAGRIGETADRTVAALALEKERSRRDTTRAALDRLTLRSPRDGILVLDAFRGEARKIAPGDTLFLGSRVASIPDLSTLRVAARLADVDDGRISVGDRCEVVLDAFPTKVWPGRVASIGPAAQEPSSNSVRRFFRVVVDLESSDPERMLPGHSAKVAVFGSTVHDGWLAPRAAIRFDGPAPQLVLAGGKTVPLELAACNALDCLLVRLPEGVDDDTRLERAASRRDDGRER